MYVLMKQNHIRYHCEQVNIDFADYLAPADTLCSDNVIVTFIILK